MRFPLCTIALLAGCNLSAVRGSGMLKVEPRPVQAFSQVSVEAAIDAEISIGSTAQVELTGDDNLLPLITTTVRGDELVISSKPNVQYRSTKHLKARIVVPTLTKLDISGTSDARLTGLEAEALDVSISGTADLQLTAVHTNALSVSIAGTADVELTDVATGALSVAIAGTGKVIGAGRAGRLDLNVLGTGNLQLAQLPVDDAQVDCAGTGDIEVMVHRALVAGISGTAVITYDGEPSIRSNITGTGRINHR